MKIISTIALISINETLIIQLISFLIFLFIINRIMFRPLRGVMSQREAHIKYVQDEIDAAKNGLDDMMARIKDEERDIKAKAMEKRAEIEALGQKEAEVIFNSAREQIHAEKEKANKQIEIQIESAKEQIKIESQVLSISIIEKVLERSLA